MAGQRQEIRRVMRTRVCELSFSQLTINTLENDAIVYVGDLVQKTEQELLRLPSFGRRRLKEIKETLAEIGLHLGMDVPRWQSTKPGAFPPRPPTTFIFTSGRIAARSR
jgi:DNA-directed RNA polymerase alpha subunit